VSVSCTSKNTDLREQGKRAGEAEVVDGGAGPQYGGHHVVLTWGPLAHANC
jgi:hypothetical protein